MTVSERMFFQNVLQYQINPSVSLLLSLMEPRQYYCSCHKFYGFFPPCPVKLEPIVVIKRLNKKGPGFPVITDRFLRF